MTPLARTILTWTMAAGLALSAGCRGEDLSFDCDYQSERFAEEVDAEGALLPEPPDGAPYPVAVVVSETGLDRLVKAVVGDQIPFAGSLPLAGFDADNGAALENLISKHHVKLIRFPAKVLDKLRVLAQEVLAEQAAKTPMATKVNNNFKKFQKQVGIWGQVSEKAYYNLIAQKFSLKG